MKEDINYWMSKCASLQQEVDVLNEKLANVSIIHWHTGEPKEEGLYILTDDTGEIGIVCFHIGFSPDIEFFKNRVIAWFKLSDIEPYKGKEESR